MEKFVLNRRHLLLGAGGLCIGATGLLSTIANAASSLAAAKSDGRIRVGFANEAPYAFASPEGKLTGLMPDVIGYIMKELGVPELEGVLTDFGGLIPGLLAKRFDILGAGLYVTPVRCKQVAASNPQYVVTESIAVKKGNPKNLHSYADIAKDEGVKIGTLAGSINAQYLAAAKVPLVPGRALAIDRRIHTFGFPFYIHSRSLTHLDAGQPFQRLMLALETGTAIVGPARGDIFTGSGDEAGELAGTVRNAADFHILIPRRAAERFR